MFLLNIISLNSVSYFDIYLKTSKRSHSLRLVLLATKSKSGVVNRVVVGSYESSHLKVYVNRDN